MPKNNIYVLDWMSNLPLDMESVRAWRCPAKNDINGATIPGWLVNILLMSEPNIVSASEGMWFVLPLQIANRINPDKSTLDALVVLEDAEFHRQYYRHESADSVTPDVYLRLTSDKREHLPESWDSTAKYRRRSMHGQYHFIAHQFTKMDDVDRAPRWALEAVAISVLEGSNIGSENSDYGFVATIDVYGATAIYPMHTFKREFSPAE